MAKSLVAQVEVSNGASNSSCTMSTLSQSFNFDSTGAVDGRNKGGSPTDTTDEDKRKRSEKIVQMKNDITL